MANAEDENFANGFPNFDPSVMQSEEEIFARRSSVARSPTVDRHTSPPQPPTTPVREDRLADERFSLMERGEDTPVPERAEKRPREEEESEEDHEAAEKRKRLEYIQLELNARERAEGLTVEEMIDTITRNKAAIIGAVTRYSGGRTQFNNNERNTVLKSLEIIGDLMIWLSFKQGVATGLVRAACEEAGPANTQISAEMAEMKAEMQRLNDALKQNEMRKEIIEMRRQMQDLKTEMIRLGAKRRHQMERQQVEEGSNDANRGAVRRDIGLQRKGANEIGRQETVGRQENTDSEAEEMRSGQARGGGRARGRGRGRTIVNTERMQQERPGGNRVDKTYASVAGATPPRPAGDGWATPEAEDRFEVVVQATNMKEPTKTLKRFKEVLGSAAKRVGPVKTVVPMKDGSLTMRCRTKDQQNEITRIIGERTNDVIVRERNRTRPKFVLTGVLAGYKQEEIVNMLYDENEDLQEIFGPTFLDEVKVIGRRKCKNRDRENITCETTANIFKMLMHKGQLLLDMAVVYVEEASKVTICHNCHKFGHVVKYCTSQLTCQYCGANHHGSTCRRQPDCLNCRVARIPREERRHSARDPKCPVYLRKENAARRLTNYK